ncbi:hypothetical protein BCPG3_138 [Bacillus phage BCPG3]|uniref:Uncharacterized protein n=1 Tax=Bacillus phage BPS10C TaxID=1277886 RepID=W5QUQ3_9CAUD|nr:hypothetical protein BPS10C_152 [Bacillus phage BPS10C]AGI12149.1 hypothetical protein BPS10C_152 [Bacillus phage BPS10C]QQO38854.1 hypothetical protein BCPG1_123 [Bacillus phage BCPG1]QSJ04455.1 hypothetical protein BCPG3_138 [Bacillus phage BCPG3]QSJ04665.1 hypothetical protein BCP18_133 [Bacillus phage BCP18]
MSTIKKKDLYKGVSSVDFSYRTDSDGVVVEFRPEIPFYIVGRVPCSTFISGEAYIIMNEDCDTITVDTSLVDIHSGPEGE